MINYKNKEDCKLKKKFKYDKYLGKNIVKAPARQLFRLNDLVFKYIRTTLQTYKVDERTFQTPCIICKGETSFINL